MTHADAPCVQAVKAHKSHKDWILAVAWSPASAHHLVSASQDATLKLWDVRAAVPLHTIEGHTEKARMLLQIAPVDASLRPQCVA